MRIDWRPELLFLALAVGCIGTYVATCFIESLRLARSGVMCNGKYKPPAYQLCGAALALGSVSIWTQQYLVLTALSIFNPGGGKLSIRVRSDMLGLSLLLVLIFTGMGAFSSSWDSLFGKPRKEIEAMVLQDVKDNLSMQRVMRLSAWDLVYILLAKKPIWLILGALFFWLGLCGVAALSIASVQYEGQTVAANAGAAVAAIVLFLVLSLLLSWLLFRILPAFPRVEWLRMVSAFSISAVQFGAQLTSILAVRFESSRNRNSSVDSISSQQLLVWLLLCSIIFVVLQLVAEVAELRGGLLKVSDELARAHGALTEIKHLQYSSSSAGDSGVVGSVLQKYLAQFDMRSQMEGFMICLSVSQHEKKAASDAIGETIIDMESQTHGTNHNQLQEQDAADANAQEGSAVHSNGVAVSGSKKRKVIPV